MAKRTRLTREVFETWEEETQVKSNVRNNGISDGLHSPDERLHEGFRSSGLVADNDDDDDYSSTRNGGVPTDNGVLKVMGFYLVCLVIVCFMGVLATGRQTVNNVQNIHIDRIDGDSNRVEFYQERGE